MLKDQTWEPHYKHLYRQQFFEYIERYNAQPRELSTLVMAPPPPELEWFEQPNVANLSPSASFLSFSQHSSGFEGGDEVSKIQKEAENYLSIPILQFQARFDVLQWWKDNEPAYPHLACVVRDIFAIPITEVGVERVFNMARDVIGDRRHRLASTAIQKIMVLKDSLLFEQEKEVEASDDSDLPLDEANDILAIPSCVDLTGGDSEEELDGDGADTEEDDRIPTPLRRPARKKAVPAKFRNNL